MDTIILPPPDELRRRIDACELELKALRRLLRISQDAHDAEDARRARLVPLPKGGADHGA
jgi:hypothetical protein